MQTASGWTIRGRVNGYVPIPEIIDRVKLLDGIGARVYAYKIDSHPSIPLSINRLLKNI